MKLGRWAMISYTVVEALMAEADKTGYPRSSFLLGADGDDAILYKRGGKRRPYVEVARQPLVSLVV